MLSRHALDILQYTSKDYDIETTYLNLVISDELPIDYKQICVDTKKDKTLSRVLEYVQFGWPEQMNNTAILPLYLKSYKNSYSVSSILTTWEQ